MMRERGKKTGLDLQDAVKAWNTPRTRDWKGGGKDCLDQDDASWSSTRPTRTTGTDGMNGLGPAVLNPQFVETLQGLPMGWTNIDTALTGFELWVMASSRRLRHLRS